ncbi:hypothetical protein BRD56_08325 [Thermoplasmatales archaeon SW_10_69_26]|nr:MAG: hypothetical protein BRD56_08325 [Thermoplasmatales archaeon SW_10_69_26]
MTITVAEPSGAAAAHAHVHPPSCGHGMRRAPLLGLPPADRTVESHASVSPAVAFETTVKLRFYDMDRAGMVFHGAYTRIFQDAFEDLMEEVGHVEKQLEDELGVRVPVVDHRMRFPAPPEGDELTVEVTVPEIGEASATFHLQAREGERTVAEADITRVCIGEDGEATPIPEPVRQGWAKHRG